MSMLYIDRNFSQQYQNYIIFGPSSTIMHILWDFLKLRFRWRSNTKGYPEQLWFQPLIQLEDPNFVWCNLKIAFLLWNKY